jgi:hypothetical protein
LIVLDAKAVNGDQPSRPRRSTKNPSHDGEGVLVRAGYSNRPNERCKSRSSGLTENSSEAPPSPRSVPPSPAERAQRLAELRAALSEAAPAFRARIDAIAAEQRGAQS